jgi:rRNA processing protein Gar1
MPAIYAWQLDDHVYYYTLVYVGLILIVFGPVDRYGSEYRR